MPVYVYVCQTCGQELEELQGINEAPLVSCPKCSEGKLKRIFKAANFKWLGSGWTNPQGRPAVS